MNFSKILLTVALLNTIFHVQTAEQTNSVKEISLQEKIHTFKKRYEEIIKQTTTKEDTKQKLLELHDEALTTLQTEVQLLKKIMVVAVGIPVSYLSTMMFYFSPMIFDKPGSHKEIIPWVAYLTIITICIKLLNGSIDNNYDFIKSCYQWKQLHSLITQIDSDLVRLN